MHHQVKEKKENLILLKMNQFTQASGVARQEMVMENKHGQMGLNMKVN